MKRFYYLIAALIFYQLPRIPMYLLTVWRKKSYIRLKWYFRTRIGTLLILLLAHVIFFISIIRHATELADALHYDQVEKTWAIIGTIGFMLIWLCIDFYWSAKVRVFKDTKKGRQGQMAAEKLYNKVDPNSFLYDHETQFNSTMQD